MKEIELKFMGSALMPVEPSLRKVKLEEDERSVKNLIEKIKFKL